ncbi:unnamed protein product [Lota lota]
MHGLCGVCSQVVLLLAAAMVLAHSLEASSYNLANERSSIERTYELTKYLEHQLKEIKDTYLSYLGPPFNEKDFSPPRPNSTALSLPSAATRLELWRGLENRARLAQNQRAYSVLLAAVKELARSTLCPYLQTSLLHFCTGLDGLLVSISGLMTSLGYALPPPSTIAIGGMAVMGEGEAAAGPLRRPAPLMMSQRRAGALAAVTRDDLIPLWALVEEDEERGGREEVGRRREATERKKGKEGGRRRSEGAGGRRNHGWRERMGGADRGRRGRRGRRGAEANQQDSAYQNTEEEEEEEGRKGEVEIWGQRRRLLSVMEEVWDDAEGDSLLQVEPERGVSLWGTAGSEDPRRQPGTQTNSNNNNNNNNNDNSDSYNYDSYIDNQYSYNFNYLPTGADTARMEDTVDTGYLPLPNGRDSSSSSLRRHTRSLPPTPPTLHPPSLSALSFFYPLGTAEEHGVEGLLALPQPLPISLRRGPGLLSPPLPPLLSSSSSSQGAPFSPMLSVRPALSDFARKVEGFWILRELQSWLWRSAKDFNRLKKRLRG